MILAIDVGGTSSKFGLLSPEKATVRHYKKRDTAEAVKKQGLSAFLEGEIAVYLDQFPAIEGVGMGLPGLLSKDRRHILELPNVALEGSLPLMDRLEKKFPNTPFKMENDAKCATLGEYHFGKHRFRDNFLLVTLGTGVGSGVIINGRLFTGARGNGLELGHLLAGHQETLEQQIGLPGFLAYARRKIAAYPGKTSLQSGELNGKYIFDAAVKKDELAAALYSHMGQLLGEGLVAAVRLLDVTNILLGGGISGAFQFIAPALKETLERHLPAYYTSELLLDRASLGNDAGLLGAASLMW